MKNKTKRRKGLEISSIIFGILLCIDVTYLIILNDFNIDLYFPLYAISFFFGYFLIKSGIEYLTNKKSKKELRWEEWIDKNNNFYLENENRLNELKEYLRI